MGWATVEKSTIEIERISPDANAVEIIDKAKAAIDTLNMIDEKWKYYDEQKIDNKIKYFSGHIIKTPTPPTSPPTSDNVNDDCGCHTGDNNNILEEPVDPGSPSPDLLVTAPPP